MVNEQKPRLSSVMGALVSGLTTARSTADMNTMHIARVYREDKFLRTFSIPRMRLPKVMIDLPLILDDIYPAAKASLASSSDVSRAAAVRLYLSLEEYGTQLNIKNVGEFVEIFQRKFANRHEAHLPILHRMLNSGVADVTLADEVADIADRLFRESISAEKIKNEEGENAVQKNNSDSFLKAAEIVSSDLRDEIEYRAIAVRSQPAEFTVSSTTSSVKGETTPETAARIRMTVSEEGMEWLQEDNDGVPTWRLVPE